MSIEKYIADLSPELQEKARDCKSVEELIELAKNENVPVPDEALAAVAGGANSERVNCGGGDDEDIETCPYCGYTGPVNHVPDPNPELIDYQCRKCGGVW